MSQGFFQEESGQGMVEYTFIVLLIALAAVIGFGSIGTAANETASNVSSSFPG